MTAQRYLSCSWHTTIYKCVPLHLDLIISKEPDFMEHELILKFTGMASLLLFILANAYYPARLVANQFRPWSGEVYCFFRRYLDIHMWLNVMAFVLMDINVNFTDGRNMFLYASLLVTVWLTLVGILKYSKKISRDYSKQMSLLRAQQTIFFTWVALVTWGIL